MKKADQFIRAKEVMSKDVFVVDVNASVYDAVKIMVKYRTDALVAMEKTIPKGVVTETDITYFIVNCADPKSQKVESIMSAPIFTVDVEDSFFDIIKTMHKKNLKRVPVVSNNVIVGMINENDITKGILQITKVLNEELRQGIITSDEHEKVETDVFKHLMKETLRQEPPWVKRQIELLQQIHAEQQQVIESISKSTKKYNLSDWRVNIWTNCTHKKEKMKNNEIIYMCDKSGKFCVYKDCPLNI